MPLHRTEHLRSIASSSRLADPLRVQDIVVIPLTSAVSELYAIRAGSGDELHVRSFLLEPKLLSKLNIIMETASSSGTAIATTVRTTKET